MSSKYELIVVGAGINGMTAAILAADAGRRVLLLERRSETGGLAAAEPFHSGFSCGALDDTLGLSPSLIERLGLQGDAELPAANRERSTRVVSDGGSLQFTEAKAEPAEMTAFFAFIARTQRPVGRLLDAAPADPITAEFDRIELARQLWALRLLGGPGLLELLRVPPMAAADWLDEYFDDPRIKLGLATPAMIGDFVAPRSPGSAALVLLNEIALRRGVRSSPTRLVRAMRRRIDELRIDVRCDHELERVEIDERGVRGITAAGRYFPAPQVIATCDPKQLFTKRLPRERVTPALQDHFFHFRCRGTLARLRIAVDGAVRHEGSPLPTGGLILGEDLPQLERAFDPVKYGELPTEPVLHLRVPSDDDPQLAPEGKSVLSVGIAYAPFAVDDDARLDRWKASILARLRRLLPSLGSQLLEAELDLPCDLEQRFSCSGGHLRHGEAGLDQLLVRPAPGCARYQTPIGGLYLGGRGSHPGPFGEGTAGALAAECALRANRAR